MARKRLPMISVVVCCYNGADVLPDCLRAIQKQNWKGKMEIIAVDDGSTDDTYKVVKSFKKVRVIRNKQNKGLAGSRNVGLQAAKGEIIAMTDQDCRPQPSWLNELYAAYADESVKGVGGAAVSKDESRFMFRYLHATSPLKPLETTLLKSNTIFYRFGLYLKALAGKGQKQQNRKRAVYSLVGANMSFRKSLVQEIHFDERFRFGGEEEDFCKRVNQKYPGSLWFAPKAKIIHQYDPRLRDTLRRSKAYGEGNARMLYKHDDVKPIIYPFPPLLIASLLLGFINPWLLFSPLILVQLLYSRWPLTAVKTRKLEPLVYGYIQAMQEWYSNIGFIKGLRGFRNVFAKERAARRQKPAKSAQVQAAKKVQSKPQSAIKPIAMATVPDKKMTLQKPHIFGILAGLLIIAAVLETQRSQVQALFVGSFISFVPGLLLLMSLRIPVRRLRGILYAVTGSLGMLLLIALIDNTLMLRWPAVFHFSTFYFAGTIGLATALLMIAAWNRTPDTLSYTISSNRLRRIAPAGYLLLLPFIGVVGSGVLNHSGNNTISMLVLGTIAILALISLLRIQKLRPAFLPLFIYIVALTIIWMGAMRGDFVSGTDVSKEFYLSNLTQAVGHWSPSLYHDPYNACLSINLLPTLLGNVLKVSNEFIFRAILPMFYALLPVMTFALYRKYAKRTVALLAGLFFIMQPIFMSWAAVPIRQMIGFVFFGALLMALFDKRISMWQQRGLVVLFTLCMVLSHYSTTYIAIACLLLAYALQRGAYGLQSFRHKWTRGAFVPTIGVPLLAVLIGISAVWYGPVNHSSSNLTHLMDKTITQIKQGHWNLFASDAHSQQTGLLDQLSLNSEPRTADQVWQSYLQKVNHKYDGVVTHPLQTKATTPAIKPQSPPKLDEKMNHHVVTLAALGGQFMSKLMRLFMVVGLGIFAVAVVKRKADEDVGLQVFALAAALVTILIIIVPYASVDYDLGRTIQQLLLLLSFPTIIGGAALVRWLLRGKVSLVPAKQLAGLLIIGYFFFVSGMIGQLTGGVNPVGMLNNFGTQYEQYVHDGEVAAAQWLRQNKSNSNIFAGYFGGNRLWLSGIDKPSLFNDILPWTIDKPSYVFTSYAENRNQLATTYYQGSFVQYQYPTALLTSHKDLLYNDGQAKIYK